MKNILFLLCAALALIGRGAENIALGKTYTFSVKPNYALCSDEGDLRQLTDGYRTREGETGSMWGRKSTVGWNNREVQIVVDLGVRSPISGFGYNLAAGAASVLWPRAVDVYVSDDGKNWRYVGDVYLKSCARTGAPDPTRYSVYHAVAEDMPCAGRYVMFAPAFSGYGFVDEIEVFKGPDFLLSEPMTGPFVTDFKSFFNKKCIPQKLGTDLRILAGRASRLPQASRDAFDAEVRRLTPLAARLPSDAEVDSQETLLPLNATHAEIWALNAPILRASGCTGPMFWKNCRWDNIDPFAIPASRFSGPLEIELMRGERRSETINVVNPTDCELACVLEVSGLPGSVRVDCREVLYSDTKDLRTVATALAENSSSRVCFKVPAGVSKQVWIGVRPVSTPAGRYTGSVKAVLGGSTVLEADIAVTVRDLDFPADRLPVLGGWDYLDGKSRENEPANLAVMRSMLQNLPCARRGVMPRKPRFDASGEFLAEGGIDLSRWEKWTAKFPHASSYLVFMAVEDSFCGEPITTPRFRRMAGSYFAAFASALKARGTDVSRVIIQLIDESHSHRTDDIHIAWAKAIRSRTDAFRLMINPIWEDPRKARKEFFEYCDIVCPWRGHVTEETKPFYRDLVKKGKELWLYSCTGPVRTFDPFAYHRSQIWEAFSLGGKGSMFWEFGGNGDSYRAYWRPGVEYSPYFVSPADATATKHSEALMEGCEDFAILSYLQDEIAALKRSGRHVKALEETLGAAVKTVLDASDGASGWDVRRDRGAADKARLSVMRELEGILRPMTLKRYVEEVDKIIEEEKKWLAAQEMYNEGGGPQPSVARAKRPERISDMATYLKWKWRTDVSDPGTGLSCAELKKGVAKIVADEKARRPWPIVKAKVLDYLIDNVGLGFSRFDCFPAMSCWNRWDRPTSRILFERLREVEARTAPPWLYRTLYDIYVGGGRCARDYDHSSPNWDEILRLGFPGMRERVLRIAREKGAEKSPFYASQLMAADAFMRFLERLETAARAELAKCGGKTEEGLLEKEIASFARLREGPPKTVFDVMQFTFIYFIVGEYFDRYQVRSFGNIDRLWWPYYRDDLAAGRTTEAEFREEFRHFIWQFGSIDNYWGHPLWIGGTNADGSTVYNPLSHIILDVVDKEALASPKLQLKISESTPDSIWDKALRMLRNHRSLVLMGEEGMARSMSKLGLSADECRRLVIWGCFEWLPPEGNCTSSCNINLVKPLELMLRDAKDGKLPDLSSFADFKREYYRRLSEVTELTRRTMDYLESGLYDINPSLVLTLGVGNALKTGRDAFSTGMRYNHTTMSEVAFASTVDSLMAVKELVYERKRLTLRELGSVLHDDWRGQEPLRLEMSRSRRKWGCGDGETDALGRELLETFTGKFVGTPNVRGGKYVCYGLNSRGYIAAGRRTGATPDGRKAGEELSKNMAPSIGGDAEGATAVIKSWSSTVDPAFFPCGLVLDMMLHSSSVSGEKGLASLRTLCEVFFRNGGCALNLNIQSVEELKDAQKHPEKYANLQVRVAGWNIRWNDIPKREQDGFIRRLEAMPK